MGVEWLSMKNKSIAIVILLSLLFLGCSLSKNTAVNSTKESNFDWPNGAKSILGIVSPNINFLKVNDKYICPTRLHYQYGSGKYCYIYIPKDIVTEFGITEELNQIAFDWYPVAAFIPN